MSDGPEKTLKMRKGWQEVARCARLDAYDVGEVSRKSFESLMQDWLAEVPPELAERSPS